MSGDAKMFPHGGVIQPSWPENAGGDLGVGPLWVVLRIPAGRHEDFPWPVGTIISDRMKREAVAGGTLREDDVAQADGGTLSRRQFPELYAVIGRLYGPPEPELRPSTRWERIVWRLTGRWPDSYVEARLAHAAEMEHRALFWDEFRLPDLRARLVE